MPTIPFSVLLVLGIAFICGVGATINFRILFFNDKHPNAVMYFCFFVGTAVMYVVPTGGIIFRDMPPDFPVLITRVLLSLDAIYAFATGIVLTAIGFLALDGIVRLSKKKSPTAIGD